MKHRDIDNQIPCVIEHGIIYGVKDIYRLIRDMGHVRYVEIIGTDTKASGEGYIMSVVASPQSATIIANRRLYLNVSGFDYLRLDTLPDGTVHFDLTNAYRVLRLIPISETLSEEIQEKPERFEEYPQLEHEDFAEIHLEDDDDFMDGE